MRSLTSRYGRFFWLVALAYWLGTPGTVFATCCGPPLDPFGAASLGTASEPHVDARIPFEGHECRMDHLGLRTTPSRDATPAALTVLIETGRDTSRPYAGAIVAGATPTPSPPPTLTTVRLLL